MVILNTKWKDCKSRKNMCAKNFTYTKKIYVHDIAAVNLSKIYFLKNTKKICKTKQSKEKKRNWKNNVNHYKVRWCDQFDHKEQLKCFICRKSMITLILSLLTHFMPLDSFYTLRFIWKHQNSTGYRMKQVQEV